MNKVTDLGHGTSFECYGMLLCRLSGDEGGDPRWAELGQNVLCSSTLWFSWAVLKIGGRGVLLRKIKDSGGESCVFWVTKAR